jgi:hypothetical protein
VTIYEPGNKVPVGSVYADPSGNWTWTSPALTDAKHDFYVTSQDAAGNVSGQSNHYGLEVDTRAARSFWAHTMTWKAASIKAWFRTVG